ncbi:MAG: Fe-S oxidoreductase [Myxococcaceae bacterium]|nr:Fe-S oxidoreductase [Myxococcaceae bacterium]
MKFLCGNCKAKYQIADEKVSGRTLRMKCRRCGHDILIDGHNMPQSTPPAAAAPQRRTSSTVSVMPGPGTRGSTAQAAPAPRAAAPGLPRPTSARSKPPSGLSADFRRHVAAPPEVPQRSAPYDLWHAAIQDVPVGPMTRDELARKIDAGAVTPESLCWREGMDDWRPLGELPELAQLLRRTRDASRPSRARPPPSVPGNQRGPQSRSAPLPQLPPDDLDDDGGEATRISDFTPPLMPDSPSSSSSFSQQASASNTSPKVILAGGSAASPLPNVDTSTQIQAPPAAAKWQMSGSTGIAIGMLLAIVLLGGPALYKATWGSDNTPAVRPEQTPVAKVEPARPVEAPPVAVSVDLPDEPADKAPVATAKSTTPKAKTQAKAEEKPTKTLSDEQRKLLERMGGGGADVDPSKLGSGRNQDNAGGSASGPALTPQQLTKVVQDNKTQLQRCYETALRAAGGKQDAAIKISVNVVVGTSGSAKSVSTQGDGLGNMTDCIRSGVKRWRFPQSGGESEFAFPLVFQPGA